MFEQIFWGVLTALGLLGIVLLIAWLIMIALVISVAKRVQKEVERSSDDYGWLAMEPDVKDN